MTKLNKGWKLNCRIKENEEDQNGNYAICPKWGGINIKIWDFLCVKIYILNYYYIIVYYIIYYII